MFGSEHDDKHIGKAMVKVLDSTIEIIMECNQCGRFSLGPFDVSHARTISHMLDEIGEKLGMERGKMIDAGYMSGEDPGIIEEGQRQFEAMTTGEARELFSEQEPSADTDNEETIDNPWSRKRSA